MDECCYSYASVPRNDTFCVPEGEQVNLYCAIINPHDSFTNLTVTWFRSGTVDMSIFDEISTTSEEYGFYKVVSNRADYSLSVINNCSYEILFRDSFSLIILDFTRHKNGYYWCQLSINSTSVQPSYRAHFSVGECNITDHRYYRLANLNEIQCAQYVSTESDAGLTTTQELPGTFSVTSSTESTRSPSVTQQKKESDKSIIIYVAGSLSALLLIVLLGVLVLAFSFAFYVHHQRKKISKLH